MSLLVNKRKTGPLLLLFYRERLAIQSPRQCEVVREVIIVNADLTVHWGCWYLGGSEAQCKQVLCRHLRKQKEMKSQSVLRKFERH